jgi:hypothetical protein
MNDSRFTDEALAEAAALIESAYKASGRQTLSCDCGAEEVYIDADAVGFVPDAERVARMIEHARYSHVGPRSIIAVLPAHLVLEVTR